MKRSAALLLGLSALYGCDNTEGPSDGIQLEWENSQTFHVAASYRKAGVKTEESTTDLDGTVGSPDFSEQWSDEVYWTYQVVEKAAQVGPGDELYEYAQKEDGSIAQLTVLRAYVDASLNDDPELLEADPVIYLVFHDDRDRLAAVVSFTNLNGERVEQAWSTKQLGRSYSVLSQSMLTAAPTYLAPFTGRYADESKTLENGSSLDTTVVDEGIVAVGYDDELGGGLVVSEYTEGEPWPTATSADNLESRLLTEDEVESRRARLPYMLPDPPEDYDFRAALARAVNLDEAQVLDADTIASGWDSGAYEGYRPWAGSWWRQSEGALIFGYDSRRTISDEIKGKIDPLKTDLDKLSESLRDMPEGDEKKKKLDEYRKKQDELVKEIVKFYDSVRQDLDGGRITIADGKVKHVDGWEYSLNELSPLDKYALSEHFNGASYNPWYAPAWEILNHYSPAGGSWWGHCNGWAAAAILTSEPRESKTTTIKGQTVEVTAADMKGLLSETHYSTYSQFYGARYNDKDDDIADLSPQHFHKIITFYLRDQKVPLVFDTSANEQVWNYPAWNADVSVTETTPGGNGAASGLTNLNTATLQELDALPGIGVSTAKGIIAYRENYGPFQTVEDVKKVRYVSSNYAKFAHLVTVQDAGQPTERTFDVVARVRFTTDGVGETHIDSDENAPQGFTNNYEYTLTTDAQGRVIGGKWEDEKEHPDFAWVPTQNPMGRPSGNSENPYMAYSAVLRIIGSEFQRE